MKISVKNIKNSTPKASSSTFDKGSIKNDI